MRHRWFRRFAGVLIVGTSLVLVLWRPWQPRSGPAAVSDPDPPVDVVSVTLIKRSGRPCDVTIMGASGNMSNSSAASLAAGETRSGPFRFPAPYTIETVIVTRAGSPRRQEVKLTLAGGQRYELLVNKDDTVVVTLAPR